MFGGVTVISYGLVEDEHTTTTTTTTACYHPPITITIIPASALTEVSYNASVVQCSLA